MMSLLICIISSLAMAAPEANTNVEAEKNKATVTDKKSTDMSFEELLVQGKYHFTDEAVTTVESDKILDGLLEVRKNFKDRIEQSAARY